MSYVFQIEGKLQMEDDLKFFWKWKTTLDCLHMEDDLIFVWMVEVFQMEGKLKMEDDPNFFVKGRQPIILGKWKTTSFFL